MAGLNLLTVPVGKGGGALALNAIKSGSIGGAHLMVNWTLMLGYKLKVDGSGYWNDGGASGAGATALAGAGSQVITLGTTFPHKAFPANVWVKKVYTRLITEFSGGAISAATISIGDAGNDDEWTDLVDIFTGASTTHAFDTADADAVFAAAQDPVAETAYAPLITIATTTANVNVLTAGEVDIWFELTPIIPDLPGR